MIKYVKELNILKFMDGTKPKIEVDLKKVAGRLYRLRARYNILLPCEQNIQKACQLLKHKLIVCITTMIIIVLRLL